MPHTPHPTGPRLRLLGVLWLGLQGKTDGWARHPQEHPPSLGLRWGLCSFQGGQALGLEDSTMSQNAFDWVGAVVWPPAPPTSRPSSSYRTPPVLVTLHAGGGPGPCISLSSPYPSDLCIFVCFGKVPCIKGDPIFRQPEVGTPLRLWAGILRGPTRHPDLRAAMQGDLLSSSYCVRLGRLRFRMEYMAMGARGRGRGGQRETADRGG